jgi:hydrogenase expression/formation protein HypC
MCLGVPGKVIEVHESPIGMTMGKVSFSGITKEVCLAYVPDVQVDEWVVVHVGFAISRIDEEEARRVFDFLASMDDLDEIEVPQHDSHLAASRAGPAVGEPVAAPARAPDGPGGGR